MVYLSKTNLILATQNDYYARSEIDSQLLETNTLYIWLKNQNRISMDKGDYFIFTPDMKRGLWLFENSNAEFISSDDIKSIERKYLNFVTTSLLVILGLGIIFIMASAASLSSSLNSSFQGCERQIYI